MEIQQRSDSAAECNYLVTVYLGYGIELQVSPKVCTVDDGARSKEQKPTWILEKNNNSCLADGTKRNTSLCFSPVKCIFFFYLSFSLTDQ